MENRPLYKAIASSLLEEIENGRYVSGLPSEAEICLKFGVSRITARGALKQLTDDGVIYVVPGKGSFPVLKQHMIPVYTAGPGDLPFSFDGKEELYTSVRNPDIYQVYEFHVHPDSSIMMAGSRLLKNGETIGVEVVSLPYSPHVRLTGDDGTPRDLDTVVATGISFDYSFEKHVFISGVMPPFKYGEVGELIDGPAVLYEVRYASADREVYARREVFIKPEHFVLDAHAGGVFDEC